MQRRLVYILVAVGLCHYDVICFSNISLTVTGGVCVGHTCKRGLGVMTDQQFRWCLQKPSEPNTAEELSNGVAKLNGYLADGGGVLEAPERNGQRGPLSLRLWTSSREQPALVRLDSQHYI